VTGGARFWRPTGARCFLDEIQSASLKVQQALLRALSMRKIKPLGSDKDIDVNVRLITATNVGSQVFDRLGEIPGGSVLQAQGHHHPDPAVA
jgi:transcriptional regulator of aromatic amino acid metabolism